MRSSLLLVALLVGCSTPRRIVHDSGPRPDFGPPPSPDRFACGPECAGRCVLGVIPGEPARRFCADVDEILDDGEPCAYDVAPLDGPAGYLTSHCSGDSYCRPDPDTDAMTCGSGPPCPAGTVPVGDASSAVRFCARTHDCDPFARTGCEEGFACTPIPVDTDADVDADVICAREGSLVEGRFCDLGAGFGCAPGLVCWEQRCVTACEFVYDHVPPDAGDPVPDGAFVARRPCEDGRPCSPSRSMLPSLRQVGTCI